MKKAILCVLLTLAMSVNAFALEVPTDTTVQNLNGSQQAIKTFTIAPDANPQELIEEPFALEGFLYTFSDIVKAENHAEDTKQQVETVTVETTKKDLSVVLEKLPPTMEYDDGTYAGTLALDHTSIHTEAAGYENRSSTVSATKTIGPVDRNDMSYVPTTTVKNGVTLKLASVDWQVIGTDLVGDALAPSSYQAVATYTGKSYYSAATGYITTAEYKGEITRDDVESVTYTLTYLGTAEKGLAAGQSALTRAGSFLAPLFPYVLAGAGLVASAILAILLVRSRRQNNQLQAGTGDLEYEDDEEEENK